MDNEKMIENIRILCKNKGISSTKLEEILGFSQGLISRWKVKTPNLDRIIDIADYFKVSLDEVVGYDNGIDDEFLLKLTERTINKSIVWNVWKKQNESLIEIFNKTGPQMADFICLDDFYDYRDSRKYISYFVTFNGGSIIIYGVYIGQNIIKPEDLRLFIQPTNESELIYQNYNMNQLMTLWLKILYSLEDSSPDEIKAEILKNEFVNSEPITFEAIERHVNQELFKPE